MGRSRADVIADLNVALLAAGHTMRSASMVLDLNHSYLSKFMRKDGYSPDVLPEQIRLSLARLLGIDERMLRIDAQKPAEINKGEGNIRYAYKALGSESDRRNAHMRIDNILQEIGRIKERLDKLEGQQDGSEPDTGKPASRP